MHSHHSHTSVHSHASSGHSHEQSRSSHSPAYELGLSGVDYMGAVGGEYVDMDASAARGGMVGMGMGNMGMNLGGMGMISVEGIN